MLETKFDKSKRAAGDRISTRRRSSVDRIAARHRDGGAARIGRPVKRPVFLSDGEKLTTASLLRTMGRDLPSVPPEVAERVWKTAIRIIAQSLVDNIPVVVHGVGSIQPYVRRGCNKYDMREGNTVYVPDRRYVRFTPSVGLLEELRKKSQ